MSMLVMVAPRKLQVRGGRVMSLPPPHWGLGGGGRGLAPASLGSGGREKRNRGHEDSETSDQSQGAKRLERAED